MKGLTFDVAIAAAVLITSFIWSWSGPIVAITRSRSILFGHWRRWSPWAWLSFWRRRPSVASGMSIATAWTGPLTVAISRSVITIIFGSVFAIVFFRSRSATVRRRCTFGPFLWRWRWRSWWFRDLNSHNSFFRYRRFGNHFFVHAWKIPGQN